MLGSIWIGLLVGIGGTCYVLGVITVSRRFIKRLEKHIDKYIKENDPFVVLGL